MSLKNDILAGLVVAMKERKTEEVSILRMVVSAIKNKEIEKQSGLSDDEVENVINHQVKQLKDALGDFERGSRDDLVKKTRFEIDFLSQYLPAQLSDEELKVKINKIIVSIDPKEEVNLGQAMGIVMKELKGQADGNSVRKIVTELLV